MAFCPEHEFSWVTTLDNRSNLMTINFLSRFLETGKGFYVVLSGLLAHVLRQLGFECKMTNSPGKVFLRVTVYDRENKPRNVWVDCFNRVVYESQQEIPELRNEPLEVAMGLDDIIFVRRVCLNLVNAVSDEDLLQASSAGPISCLLQLFSAVVNKFFGSPGFQADSLAFMLTAFFRDRPRVV